MIVSIYIYDANNLIEKPCLTDNILEHTNRYNNQEKRRISESNYHMASLKLNDLGANLDSFRFINGKPIIDDYYISFSHNNSYYGFSISNLNHGLDFEGIVSNEKVEKLSKKILKDKDHKLYLESDNKNIFLTKFWCEMEAAGKMDGCGIDLKFRHPDYIYKSFIYNDNVFVVSAKEEFDIVLYVNDKRCAI